METRAHHVLIGIFVIAVATVGTLFALWLAKSDIGREARLYDIVFYEAVTGLSVGSSVNYSGIRVGEVESLRLDPKDPAKVWARVKLASDTPITQATRARLTVANITGSALIQLYSEDPQSPPLKAENGKVPIIVADPSAFARLRLNSEELFMNISRLVDGANKVFSEENTQSIEQVLNNLEVVTGVLADHKEDIGVGVKELAATSGKLHQAIAGATRLFNEINTQVDQRGEQIFTNADEALTSLRQMSATLQQLVGDNRPAIDQGLREITALGPAIKELQHLIEALNGIARRLEENPADYLLGGDTIREVEP